MTTETTHLTLVEHHDDEPDLAEPDYYFWVTVTSVGLACLSLYLAWALQHWFAVPVALVAWMGARDASHLHGYMTRGALLSVLISGVALIQFIVTLGQHAPFPL